MLSDLPNHRIIILERLQSIVLHWWKLSEVHIPEEHYRGAEERKLIMHRNTFRTRLNDCLDAPLARSYRYVARLILMEIQVQSELTARKAVFLLVRLKLQISNAMDRSLWQDK